MKRRIKDIINKNDFLSLYIHIPFCKKKCYYCDFYSIDQLDLKKFFLKSFFKELKKREYFFKNFKIRTLYIGGGTPSVLDAEELEFLFLALLRYINTKDLLEFSFEANPESINKDKVELLKKFGVNRISLGVQSLYDDELKFLGRIHSYEDFLRAYSLLRRDFEISIDLIYGLPKQKPKSFIEALKKIVSLIPHHISIYALEIHKKTNFYGRVTIDETLQKEIYLSSVEFLEKNGYIQYEISNFSLDGYQSIHNNNYWYRGNYVGFGPSSSSCFNNIRWKNISNLYYYINSLNNGKIELEYIEQLSFKDVMNEKLMLCLRTRNGISDKSDLFDFFKKEIEKSYNEGYLEYINGFYILKKEYIFVFNRVVSDMFK